MCLIKKCICLALFYYFTTTITDGIPVHERFDYKFFPEVNGSIKLHQMPVTWHQARLRCHYEGAVLASPLNSKFLKIMKILFADNHVQSCGVFTGIHSLFDKGVYISMEGVPLSRIPVTWAPNEPDNFNNSEDCLMMLANGTMADVKYTDVLPYMCFKKNEDFLSSNCGTVDPEYTLDATTGSCYKIHRTGEIWSRAYMICAAEGGHLAIINSEEEYLVINKLFGKYANTEFKGTAYITYLLLGYLNWGDGNWYTIHGETLEQAGFAKWCKDSPDNQTKNGVGESCGSLIKNKNSGLDDFWCNVKAPFVCEKSPVSLIPNI